MKILQLCNKFPYPPHDGGAIATLNVTRAFARHGHEVTVLAMNTSKHYFDLSNLPQDLAREVTFHSVYVDTEFQVVDAVKALFLNRSYHVQRFMSGKYAEQLKFVLQEGGPYDVIQLEGLYLTPYIPVIRTHSTALVSLRAHNIEHQIWERIAEHEPCYLRKQYLRILIGQLKRYERQQLRKVDVLVPISQVDETGFRQMGYSGPIHTTPASFDEQVFISTERKPSCHRVFFLGALDWIPNINGLKWFLREVWEKVCAQQQGLVLQIAGRNMPDEIKAIRAPNIQILGEVADAIEFMNTNHLMIVPLFSGSGMRVKIIEGMALGKVIVTTPIGAVGIEGKDGEHFLLATTAEDFVRQILRCVNNHTLSTHLSENAMGFARRHYGSMPLTHKLAESYREMISALHKKEGAKSDSMMSGSLASRTPPDGGEPHSPGID